MVNNNKEVVDKIVGGRLFSSGLFKEFGRGKNVCYSLEKFKEVFMAKQESSGYLCAAEVVTEVLPKNRWEEWNRIFNNPRMHSILEAWKEELEIRVRANAESLVALGCDKEAFPRLRYILDGNLHGKRKVGRPTKGELTKKERINKGIKDLRTANPGELDEVLDEAAKPRKEHV